MARVSLEEYVLREGRFRAVIYKKRQQCYLGVYEEEILAARAYDEAAVEYFGAGAKLNFPNSHSDGQAKRGYNVKPQGSNAVLATALVQARQAGRRSPRLGATLPEKGFYASTDSDDSE